MRVKVCNKLTVGRGLAPAAGLVVIQGNIDLKLPNYLVFYCYEIP